HFDGTAWDLRHVAAENTRWFSIGAKGPTDAWVAGETDGKVGVVHYDGTNWTDADTFAGAKFSGFSHGPGPRVLAMVDWDIFELADDGSWKSTNTHDNDVFGAPVDIWVAEGGDAWALTSGTKLLHLPKDSQHWSLEAPPPDNENMAGLAL